ncbi:MAG: PAS domain S-box protein [Gammaproteobacteria bacterium]|nr:PAS domain S-box protein [Gammaproteobacteria bacterium]
MRNDFHMAAMLTFDEKDFQSILNGMVDGVIIIDHQGSILMFNKTAETMFGYQREEVTGRNISMLMPEPDSSSHDAYLHNFISTNDAHIIGIGRDVTALKKNGETFPMHLSVIEYPAQVEGNRWFIGSCKDITLNKQQEEQLNRSIKMEAIGKLTSGLAHDYNNMLGVILGYSELLSDKAKDQPELMGYIEAIQQAANRATSLTQKLLSISRKRTDSAEATQINDILKNNQEILSKTLTATIKLSIHTENDLWPVFIEQGCLEDTILNLSINAMHAMPEGGELDFTTSNIHIASVDAQVLNIPSGNYVKLSIRDTGIGMKEDVVSHIFEPFYSTKGDKGTGLGLSQVYNFVTESNGTIRVYSEPGLGTCFSIFLPRYRHEQSNNEPANAAPDKENKLNGSENILIVDDEPELLRLTKDILLSYGYTVFSSSSAKEALLTLENETIDLVISDVVMPDMDGFELAHIISYTHPNIKIQLCSGLANVTGKTVTNETLAKNILTKPFTSKQILTNVQELLNN